LFNLVILGVGPFVGSLLWGRLGDVFRHADGSVDFSRLFIAPAMLALAAALLMMMAFKPAAGPERAGA
jgi:predicted MFS family arabinose efflux permease